MRKLVTVLTFVALGVALLALPAAALYARMTGADHALAHETAKTVMAAGALATVTLLLLRRVAFGDGC